MRTSALCILFPLAILVRPAAGAEPASFNCAKAKSGIEKRICADPALSALDRRLAGILRAAMTQRKGAAASMLRAEQRGWIKERDGCGKSPDQTACIRDRYRRRMSELQARHALVPSLGPFRFACGPKDSVAVTFFRSEIPAMIARRGAKTALMFSAPAASGARYQGRDTSFWEHQGEAQIVWGRGAAPMTCRPER